MTRPDPPVYPPPPTYYSPPPKRSFWSTTGGAFTIAGIVLGGVALIVVAVVAFAVADYRSGVDNMKVELVSCTFSGDEILPTATVEYTVKNTGDSTRGVTIRLEYRDRAGRRVDTDTAYVRNVSPGDTVRGEESTLLDASASGGTCKIVGIS